MKPLEKLLDQFNEHNIRVIQDNSILDNIARAFSITMDGNGCVVYSNRDLNSIEERCVLEHEYTHFDSNLFYKLNDHPYYKKVIESDCDYKTAKRLVPLTSLLECINQKLEDYEICEKLEITQDILNLAKNIYEEQLNAYIQRS